MATSLPHRIPTENGRKCRDIDRTLGTGERWKAKRIPEEKERSDHVRTADITLTRLGSGVRIPSPAPLIQSLRAPDPNSGAIYGSRAEAKIGNSFPLTQADRIGLPYPDMGRAIFWASRPR